MGSIDHIAVIAHIYLSMLITLFTFGFRFVGFVIRTRSNTIALSNHATIWFQCLFAHRMTYEAFFFELGEKLWADADWLIQSILFANCFQKSMCS